MNLTTDYLEWVQSFQPYLYCTNTHEDEIQTWMDILPTNLSLSFHYVCVPIILPII